MTDKPDINVLFVDFWHDVSIDTLYKWSLFTELISLFSDKYNVVLYKDSTDKNVDVLIASVFGRRNMAYLYRKSIRLKILISGEANTRYPIKNPHKYDYIISTTNSKIFNANFIWYPFAFWYTTNTIKSVLDYRIKYRNTPKKRFTACVISNGSGYARNKIIDELCKYKELSFGGKYRKNCDIIGSNYQSDDILEFYASSKFVFVGENCIESGYITEKIMTAFSSGSIPIYVGPPEVIDLFNPLSFIYIKSIDDIGIVKLLDNDPIAYQKMRAEPIFSTLPKTGKDVLGRINLP